MTIPSHRGFLFDSHPPFLKNHSRNSSHIFLSEDPLPLRISITGKPPFGGYEYLFWTTRPCSMYKVVSWLYTVFTWRFWRFFCLLETEKACWRIWRRQLHSLSISQSVWLSANRASSRYLKRCEWGRFQWCFMCPQLKA